MRRFPVWHSISREERYFTAILFHDLRTAPNPFWDLLRLNSRRHVAPSEVADVAFEACFFRDVSHRGLITRHKELEKQTFDLVLFLSNREIVLIEAKAQQGFAKDQIDNLKNSREIIASENIFKAVHLGALFSSGYSPKERTICDFDMHMTWAQLSQIREYARNARFYERADKIYSS